MRKHLYFTLILNYYTFFKALHHKYFFLDFHIIIFFNKKTLTSNNNKDLSIIITNKFKKVMLIEY